MKLIIGYFAAICILLTGLSVFASLNAPAEAEAFEPAASDTLQPTRADVLIPSQDRVSQDDLTDKSFAI